MNWARQLDGGKGSRGSRPCCVLLAEGAREEVAERLTAVVDLPGVFVLPDDRWQPYGTSIWREGSWDNTPACEVELVRRSDLVGEATRLGLRDWWLAVPRGARTPSWDLAATCRIRGERGLLLVEAKAHANELATAGKDLPNCDSRNSLMNHERIGEAIKEAANGLSLATGGGWAISRDDHYQISNRFAWSWKLATLGVPVVLVYLGFLNAVDVSDLGPPFGSARDWEAVLRGHSFGVVDDTCWGEWTNVDGVPMIALVRAYSQPLEPSR